MYSLDFVLFLATVGQKVESSQRKNEKFMDVFSLMDEWMDGWIHFMSLMERVDKTQPCVW